MQWLAPYLTVVPKIVPLRKLKKVYGYKTAQGKRTQTLGMCHRFEKNGHYAIGVNIGAYKKDQSIGTILQTLTHELAHMVHWEHTPEHAALEATIYKRFAKRAKALGVKDFSRPRRGNKR